ncbi:MAG: hypothetical protein AABX78_00670, partial [Nanoarchaeota archaeon]
EGVVKEVETDLHCIFSVDELVAEFPAQPPDNPWPSHFYSGRISGEPRPESRYVSEGRWFGIEDARREELAFEHNVVLELLAKKIS